MGFLKNNFAKITIFSVVFLLGASLFASPAPPANFDDVQTNMNILWLVIASAMIMFMQLGFIALEAGFVRAKNSTNVTAKGLLDLALGALVYFAIGYAFMYGKGNAYIGMNNFFLSGIQDNTMDMTVWLFNSMFAPAVTATRPAKAPLSAIPISVSFVLIAEYRSAETAPAAPPRVVFTATFATSPFAISTDPPLNPYHPNQSINVPIVASGMLCPGIAFALPDLENFPYLGPSTIAPVSAIQPPSACIAVDPARS